MNYVCADRGSEHCPCRLMESGQCYTCTMVSEGRCSCEERAGWQGICPYSEYIQQGGMIRPDSWDQPAVFRILSKTSFARNLSVVRVAVPSGLAEKCRRPGSYMMAEALDGVRLFPFSAAGKGRWNF